MKSGVHRVCIESSTNFDGRSFDEIEGECGHNQGAGEIEGEDVQPTQRKETDRVKEKDLLPDIEAVRDLTDPDDGTQGQTPKNRTLLHDEGISESDGDHEIQGKIGTATR